MPTISPLVSAQEEHFIPDANLRRLVRERLEIPDQKPLLTADMKRLYDLVSIDDNIESLKGLEYATELSFLHLSGSNVSDLSPLVELLNLQVLKLYNNNISDISSLAKLTNLVEVNLSINQITDFIPLLKLSRLESLYIGRNPGDLKALTIGLNPTDIAICDTPRPSVLSRVNDRGYPSIFAAWHNIINLRHLSWDDRLAYHDLHFTGLWNGMEWREVLGETKVVGNVTEAQKTRDKMLMTNPRIFLVEVNHYCALLNDYPEDWEYWIRDASGNRVPDVGWNTLLIDFTQPAVQDRVVKQVIAVAECGLYDGIMLDWWSEEWNTLFNRETKEVYCSLQAEVDAKVSILRRIREAVGNDFLILANTNRSKIPRSAPYVNGTFMETERDNNDGYTRQGLQEIESTLLWSEKKLREPRINCLEGWGLETEPLDSSRNQQWMRVFTTMNLTHSDGYVVYVSGIGSQDHEHAYEIWEGHSETHESGKPHDHQHEHYWYDFWNADLGQPVGEKGKLYDENISGLFIREFTNGWAVYNRSGQAQEVSLPIQTTGVTSGITNFQHTLPDLDGEIYLKTEVNAVSMQLGQW